MNIKSDEKTLSVFIACCCLLLMLMMQPPAAAHQQKAALTTVSFNVNTQTTEIIHRFSLHDAEHAVKRIFDKEADIYQSSETRAMFADYIYRSFAIITNDDAIVDITEVGHEIDGKFFWVYQELGPMVESGWKIRHIALHEIWRTQTNTVNVEMKDKTNTLILTKESPQQNVSFE